MAGRTHVREQVVGYEVHVFPNQNNTYLLLEELLTKPIFVSLIFILFCQAEGLTSNK
jgi:hypothetical protein